MLTEQRNNWNIEFKKTGMCNNVYLNNYRINKDSNSWRMSSGVEHLCEYILFLEEKVGDLMMEIKVRGEYCE